MHAHGPYLAQDVEDSIARAQALLKAKALGRYDAALKLAITGAEADDIDRARKLASTPVDVAEAVAPTLTKRVSSLNRTRQLTGQL